MRKIVYISGTRADFGLMKSVLKEIDKSKELDLIIVVTGMHLMSEFGHTIRDIETEGFETEIIKAYYDNDNLESSPRFLGEFLHKLTNKLIKIKPDILFLLGDRSEMLAGAIAGQYLNIPVAHVSGGDLTGHVDDSIRHAITKIAHAHFPISKRSAERIINMRERPGRVFFTGSPSVDSIKIKRRVKSNLIFRKYKINISNPYVLVIQHPVITEINDVESQMRKTLDAIIKLKIQSIVIYPNADSGGRKIISVIQKYAKYDFIKSSKNVNYDDYLGLLQNCAGIIGNSSSAIVESTSLGVPAINIGTRQKGRERAGNVIDVNYDTKEILDALDKILNDKKFKELCKKMTSPYGDGNAGKKIKSILCELRLDKRLLNKTSSVSIIKPVFKRFNELKDEDINFDFHMHTNQTDGSNSAKEMISYAEKIGLKSIGFTEHVNRDSTWFGEFKANIERLRSTAEIEVFIGVEVKAIDFNGTIDATNEMILESDIVMGSVHRYPEKNGGLISLEKIAIMEEMEASEIEFNLSIGMLRKGEIDILGHPLGMCCRFFNKFNKKHMELLFKEALKQKIAIDINTKYLCNQEEFFRLLREVNPYVSFGSDAHNKKEIGRSFDIIRKEIKK